MKKRVFKIFITLILFVISSFVFVKDFCKLEKIQIKGLDVVPIKELENLPINNSNLFLIDREKIAEYLSKIELIESFNIKRIPFNTLVIEVKEKNILGIIKNNDNYFYITSKFEIIPKKNNFNNKFLPLIETEKKISFERLISVLKGLNLIKYYDKNFFYQIEKIHLKEIEITYIFIRNKMSFLLKSIPTELDFLKIVTLYKIFNSGKFDLRSDYILNI